MPLYRCAVAPGLTTESQRARIAKEIVRRRAARPITTTVELARLVEEVLGPGARRYRIHPATRTFQALRIEVNQELDHLEQTVADAVSVLRRGGRVAVISYHSLEDRPLPLHIKEMVLEARTAAIQDQHMHSAILSCQSVSASEVAPRTV